MPDQPTGARIEHDDGRIEPLRLEYGAATDDGGHVWHAHPTRDGWRALVTGTGHLAVAVLPAHTAVHVVDPDAREDDDA